MNNFLRFIYQALSSKVIRTTAPVVDAPDTTTVTETITLTETTFPYTAPTDTTSEGATSLFSCGSGVRHSSTYTITSSSNYTWVKGPWITPGCWVHVQSSGSIIGSLGTGVTGNLYPEGYYGNTLTGELDPESSRPIAQPWLTQKRYPPGNFLTINPKPYSLVVCLENYYGESGNDGSVYIPRNYFASWAELYSASNDKPSETEGGFIWLALNHNSSGVSGSITVVFDIYYECDTISIPSTTSTTATTGTDETTTTDSTTTDTTPDTTTAPGDIITVPGDGFGSPE